MIIVTHEEKVKFLEIGEGDVFEWQEHFYIKIEEIIEEGKDIARNAVSLRDGKLITFSSDNMVVPINGRFVLERN